MGKELLTDGAGEFFLDDSNPIYNNIPKLLFGEYIRPVCLPCSLNGCLKDVLKIKNKKGQILINDVQSETEMCNIQSTLSVFKQSTVVVLHYSFSRELFI